MRNTPLLEAVKNIFKSFNSPITVPQIQDSLRKKNLSPHKTSLYRMLEKLKKENFIEDLLLDSKTVYYELKTHHHHHFRCQKCDEISCIRDSEFESQIHTLEEKLKTQGFSIKDHHFSLSGKCITCA